MSAEKVVPREPTENMLRDAHSVIPSTGYRNGLLPAIWQAMFDAAPAALAAEPVGEVVAWCAECRTELGLPSPDSERNARGVVVPQSVRDWHAAEKARIEAVAAYNAHHAYVKAHCPLGTSVNEQYQAMEKARREAFALLPALFAGLTEMLATTPPHAQGCGEGVEVVGWPTEARHAGNGDWHARTAIAHHTMSEGQALVWNACRAACKSDYDRLAAENARLRDAQFSPSGDNHHNALRCPYCNPDRIDPAAMQAKLTAAEAARDEAVGERDRLRAHANSLHEQLKARRLTKDQPTQEGVSERINWRDADRDPPDSDTTVLVECLTQAEPVWLGYLSADGWLAIEGHEIAVTRWAHMPAGVAHATKDLVVAQLNAAGVDPDVDVLRDVYMLPTQRVAFDSLVGRLADLRSQLAQVEADRRRLDTIATEYLDLRCFDMPTGAGDADVGWRVIDHHMQPPCERVVAEVFRDDPREALDAAFNALLEAARP